MMKCTNTCILSAVILVSLLVLPISWACGIGTPAALAEKRCSPPSYCTQEVVVRDGLRTQVSCRISPALSGDQLWELLAWVGGNGDWAEVDPGAWLPSTSRSWLSTGGQSWVLQEPGKPALWASLSSKGNGQVFGVRIWTDAAQVPPPLAWVHKGNAVPFADFVVEGTDLCLLRTPLQCRWRHSTESGLSAEMQKGRLTMRFQQQEATDFPRVANFRALDMASKMEAVEDLRAYLLHELALAVKVFLHTTPGLFNWQPWHWMQQAPQGIMGQDQLIAFLEAPALPAEILLFQKRCAKGEHLRIFTNGRGIYTLVLEP